MPEPEARELHALSQYWNRLARDAREISPPSDVDPLLAEAVVWVLTRDDAPAPEADFVAQLQDDLLGSWSAKRQPSTLPASHTRAPNGGMSSHHAPRFAPAADPRRKPWLTAHLATAVLLVVTLLVSVVGLRSARLGWSGEPEALVGIPALEDLPANSTDPATGQGLLAEVTVPTLPLHAGLVDIERWTYPPTSDSVTTPPLTGPLLILVTTGTVTVSLDGEEAVLNGLEQSALSSPLDASTGELAAGATLLVPAQTRLTTSNRASTASTALVVAIVADTMSDWTLPWGQTTIAQEPLAKTQSEFSPGPAQIALRRDTLDPEETVPAPTAGTLQLVAAESKYLGYLTRSPDGVVTNREPDALGVLILTVTQPPAT